MTAAAAADQGESLYAAQRKIYPREVTGRFARLRVFAVIGLLGIFYGLPWLEWSGRQAVLFDLPARRFYVFGLTLFPQDFVYLTWLLIIAALSLFFFTALGGRLFCGYACPQTVWSELFVAIERVFEGKRAQRMKLDRAPFGRDKLLRKGAKQLAWIALALATGCTFVGYFTPIRELVAKLPSGTLGPWETFWILFYGAATYANAGYMREQVCKYMCPYARFQSAMFDNDTLIISYDPARGEPRGSRRRGTDPRSAGLGDCIDCTLCVQVCPTGIDIRNGLQYECIACAACIDACDDVMARMNYPPGLIRYATQAALDGRRTRPVRARTLIYGALLSMLIVGFGIALAGRSLLELDVLRDRNAMYRELADGTIENVYLLRISNKDAQSHEIRIGIAASPGLIVETDQATYDVAAGEVFSLPARVRDPAGAQGPRTIEVVVESIDTPSLRATHRSRFVAPGPTQGTG
jgi:cytochrome c oxidase accessory protein FixG